MPGAREVVSEKSAESVAILCCLGRSVSCWDYIAAKNGLHFSDFQTSQAAMSPVATNFGRRCAQPGPNVDRNASSGSLTHSLTHLMLPL